MPAAFVFVQEGCGACEAYLPTFTKASEPYKRSFPIGVYDLAKMTHHLRNFANTLKVEATPTTVVLDRAGRLHKVVGALGPREIDQLLRKAL